VNGAGKTTLLKCLLDLCGLNAGAIEIHGIAHRRPEARARLAYLPEQFVAPYFLTGREFLATMQEFSGRRYDEAAARRMFELLDLDTGALDKPVRVYSKGMRQKLGLAACFLAGREFCVLDEPLSGLDPKSRACVRTLLLRQKSEGRTVLLTAHSLPDIEEICDHIAVLHDAKLVFYGPPPALLQRFRETSLEQAFLKCIGSEDCHA